MSFRRSTRYPCATYGCSERSEWVETRTVQPNGLPAGLGFYGWCAAHVPDLQIGPTDHDDPSHGSTGHTEPLTDAQILPVREIPLGMVEIATLLGVKRGTVEQWRHRGIFPDPDLMVSSTPLWWRETVVEFAQRTGRGV